VPIVAKLPPDLEDGKALMKRRERAAQIKAMWRDIYEECYRYAMPQRETFNTYAPGQRKNFELYDSTAQQAVGVAANNAMSLLCPAWKHWAALAPGSDIPEDIAESPELIDGLQEATATLFHYLNHSNFSTVVPEVFLDLMIGTGALCVDEGDTDDPLVFDAVPLSLLEIEEGPRGTVETVFMERKPLVRNLERMYTGMTTNEWPESLKRQLREKPEEEVQIIQGSIFSPKNRHSYGVVLHGATKKILWRYDYEDSPNPVIVARSSVVSGETYGRGRVMACLPDIKSLNTMQEYVLRHAARVAAPTYTGLTDAAFNPFTAVIVPNTIIPVGSNDTSNPSLRLLESGAGDFVITEAIMENLRDSVRRTLLGERNKDARVHSATEVAIDDRNRLWDMGAEFGRIQAELLSRVVARSVWILQKQGKMPAIKVDGRAVTLKYVSPLAKAQDQEDLLALGHSLELAQLAATMGGEAGMAAMALGFKLENLPAWLAKRTGLDADLVRSETERKKLTSDMAAAAAPPQGAPVAAPREPLRAVA